MNKYISLILVILLAFCMTACNNKESKKEDAPKEEKATTSAIDTKEKVTVEKGDWTSAEKEDLKFDVRDNWANEKRDYRIVEYFYFDESKENYLMVAIDKSSGLTAKNSEETLQGFLGEDILDSDSVEFEQNELVTLGKDIGGYKIKYKDKDEKKEFKFSYIEFFTIYEGKIYWILTQVREDYVEDYKDDIEQIFNSLATVSGNGNPIIKE